MPRDRSVRSPRLLAILAAAIAVSITWRPAQAQPGPGPVSAQELHAAVEAIARLLSENYVFPELGQRAGAVLVAKETQGAYAGLTDPVALAEALTRDLQAIAHDEHLRVAVHPPQAAGPPPGPEDPEAERRQLTEEARVEHYGFREVRILPGNLGFLRLDEFLPAEYAGPTAEAAMRFLRGVDALLVDLRHNGGGEPDMVQLLQSYLLAKPTHLTDFYWRQGDRRDQVWSLPWVPGGPMPEVPVYVLTSANTFSGAESFSYDLKVLKRVTVVGETTGGGANPGDGFDAGGRFGLFVPTGRPINPTTGTNWEGTGVEPDVKVAASDALATAQALALEALAAKATSPQAAMRYRFARLTVEGELHPFTAPASKLPEYAGSYGPYRVAFEDGVLVYLREGRPQRRMTAVAADVFRVEGLEGVLLRFERDAAGKVVKSVGLHEGGESDELPRLP
jgi:hypothetical protein